LPTFHFFQCWRESLNPDKADMKNSVNPVIFVLIVSAEHQFTIYLSEEEIRPGNLCGLILEWLTD